MKYAIIADDLTGAGDSGVQLARSGLATSVFIRLNQTGSMAESQSGFAKDAAVFDTDSRAVPADEAYRRVIGQRNGYISSRIGEEISGVLGAAAARLIAACGIKGLVLTGGDTAKQVCTRLKYDEFELMDEVEPGVPFGKLIGNGPLDLLAVTKAGNFGSGQTLLNALKMLRGES